MYKTGRKLSILISALVMFFVLSTTVANAATAQNYYGSESYVQSYGETFNIGVYIESEDVVGDYEIHLSYDENYLQYVSGATTGGNGEILISGTANTSTLKVLLSFEALAVGETTLVMESAYIEAYADNAEMEIISEMPIAPIIIESVSGIYPSALYIGEAAIEGFEPTTYEYNITLTSAESLEITDDEGDTLESTVSTTVTEEGDETVITANYQKGGESILYTFNITVEEESEPEADTSTEEADSTSSSSAAVAEATSTSSGGLLSALPTGMDVILVLVGLELVVLLLTLINKK